MWWREREKNRETESKNKRRRRRKKKLRRNSNTEKLCLHYVFKTVVLNVLDGRIILEWIFMKWDVGVRAGVGWFRIGIGGGRL
jgi:hypothetical protein